MLPERKHTRLKKYDYSGPGAYYVTEKRMRILSRIIVGRGLAPAGIDLSEYGRIAEQQLFLLEKRYSFVKIDKYVVMPDHIHVIVILKEYAAGASPRPTLFDILCVYKSLTTRACKQAGFGYRKLFQDSFYEHIIRNRQDYEETWEYIQNNPARWIEKKELNKTVMR